MLICVGLGFASGLPLFLLIQLVPAWLRLEGVSLTAIGFFTAIQYPYSLKFLWSPAIERYSVPWLGRRRGWMLVTQILLIISISALGLWRPQDALLTITLVAVAVAVFSATQDIVIDAYRRELLVTAAGRAGAGVPRDDPGRLHALGAGVPHHGRLHGGRHHSHALHPGG